MASDFSLALQNKQPIKTVTSIGATNFVEIKFPITTKRISVGCEGKALYMSFSYADTAAAALADCVFIPADNMYTMTVPNGIDSVYVVSKAGAAANVVIVMEDFT